MTSVVIQSLHGDTRTKQPPLPSPYEEAELEFRQCLEDCVNGVTSTAPELILSVFSPDTLFRDRAEKVIQSYRHLLSHRPPEGGQAHSFHLSEYSGQNPHVRRMATLIRAIDSRSLHAAVVHGSLGDCKEIPYSDFDGLVVLRDEALSSAEALAGVARRLASLQGIMHQFDLLQHHGWFVLVEADFQFYPDYYLPLEALCRSKSLLSAPQLNVTVSSIQDSLRYRQFLRLSESILHGVDRSEYPRNAYQLKSFMSRFMLLPALFIQALEERGVSKEESFDLARGYFSAKSWAVMDEVSLMRERWHLPESARTKLLRLLASPRMRFLVKRLAPSIPPALDVQLTSEFYKRVCDLIEQMVSKIQ